MARYIDFFFFSSRRRHTRLQGDWSSDVCSSDLLDVAAGDDVIYTIQQATFLTIDITDRTRVGDRTVHQGQYFQLETLPPNAPRAHHVVLRSKQGVVICNVSEDRFEPRHGGLVPCGGR